MAYKAFVSSTFEDLIDHRKEVIAALRKAGISVDPMEDWTAASDEPKRFSQDRIRDCDVCVLLVAFRRGHVPEGDDSSITQLEYQAAVDSGIDVLVFMLGEDSPWPRKFDELDKDPEIGKWRAELKEHQGVGFFGLKASSIEIAPALTRWIIEKQQVALSSVVARPSIVPWSPKTVRIGMRCGLLQQVNGKIEFTKQVAESLRSNGLDWILGKPLQDSDRVLADWTEYSAMSIVVATKPGTILAEELQEHLYIECQHHLIGYLLELALKADVMRETTGQLAVADALNEEMMEVFQHIDSLDYLDEAGADPRTAVVLAFVDMVRARLLLHAPDQFDYAEALGTLILSQFGFWEGPEVPTASTKAGSRKPRRSRKSTRKDMGPERMPTGRRGAGSLRRDAPIGLFPGQLAQARRRGRMTDIAKALRILFGADRPPRLEEERFRATLGRWKNAASIREGWFDWSDGQVYTKAPDSSLLRKMVAIANALGAVVLGDGGERYTGEKPMVDTCAPLRLRVQ